MVEPVGPAGPVLFSRGTYIAWEFSRYRSRPVTFLVFIFLVNLSFYNKKSGTNIEMLRLRAY
jgi:hypothetical protein